MNNFIEQVNILPFASWTHLYITVPQAMLLAVIVIAIAWWRMQTSKAAFMTALASMAMFMLMRSYSFLMANAQQKLVVYNISGKSAMDFIDGRNYYFAGDAVVQHDPLLRNFHLEPSRIISRASGSSAMLGLLGKGPLFWFNGKHILVLDSELSKNFQPSFPIDLLVLSKNPGPSLSVLQGLQPRQVVADASNAAWKTAQWQQQCSALHIPFYSVAQSGAYIMDCR
jgi:competence protein ComEC